MNKPVKFLLLRFSSIGDIVLTTPVIRCLKLQHPNAEIHYFTKARYSFLLEENPHITKTWLLEDNLSLIIPQLKEEHFDYIIDLHTNIRTLRIKMALGVKAFSFSKLNLRKFLLTTFKVNYLPDNHVVDRYLKTIENFGIQNDNKGLDYFIPRRDFVAPEQLPGTHQEKYIAYAIGGQHFTKKLPVNRMIQLCHKLDSPVILLGGKEDFNEGEAVRKAVGSQLIYNACGSYNFNQSASILQRARVVFTHDTGLMHVAAAFKKKIYSLWGNTVPAFGMYPYQTAFEIIENNNLACRPCSKIGHKACPKKHFKCMNDLRFDFDLKEQSATL